ncbi:MAG TPA: nuclear transport factor 2 family protein [Pyrinomonadaceae bacterium]|nr:nuclear transport factor 2 family protein [Pyrinomonadaceae bacterium]
MKRLVALAALCLLPLCGCTQPAEAPANANATTANANAKTTASPATVSEAAITDQEKKIWDAIKGKDYDGFGNMLTDDFIFVAPDGIYDKAGTIKSIKDYNPTEVNLSNWKVLPIDKDAAVVVYQSTVKGTAGGKPIPDTPSRESSVWINRGGKWVAIFHQSTDVAPAPAAPPANANSAAKPANTNASPAASPASSSAEPTDPLAKEKQIWEELKRKDYDAFASDLADNSIEVEPDGVYDKAGSVNGVKNFDVSKLTLADFKEVKIDDDATIVTYVVKGGRTDERHSTVWMKRGNKWVALFHQGSPAAPPAK